MALLDKLRKRGIKKAAYYQRLKLGWTIDEACGDKPRENKRKMARKTIYFVFGERLRKYINENGSLLGLK